MAHWFNKAFDAIQKGFNYGQQKITEVLPTPGKRKREHEEDGEKDDLRPATAKLRVGPSQAHDLERLDSVQPASQFARATKPAMDLSRTTSTAGILRLPAGDQDLVKKEGSLIESPNVPISTPTQPQLVRRAPWPSAVSKKASSGPKQQSDVRNMMAAKNKGQRKTKPDSRLHILPWQMKYTNPSKNHFSFGAAVRNLDDPGHFKRHNRFHFAHDYANRISKEQDFKDLEEYRRMTKKELDSGPIFAGKRQDKEIVDLEKYPSLPETAIQDTLKRTESLEERRQEGNAQVPPAKKTVNLNGKIGNIVDLNSAKSLTNHEPDSSDLPADETYRKHERDRRKEEIEEELRRKDREKNLQQSKNYVNQLIKNQDALFARASLVLGETRQNAAVQGPRNAAAEISRASMQLATKEGRMLQDEGIALIEEQQALLESRRQAKLDAHKEAQSVARTTKPTQFWSNHVRSPLKERPLMNGTTNHRVLPEKNFQKLFKPVQAKREEEVLDLSSEEEEETGEDETPDTFDGILDDHWERDSSPADDVSSQDLQDGEGESAEDDESAGDDDDDEQTLTRKFRGILVDDRRVVPQFPRLTGHQFNLYKDAINESEDQDVEMFLHKSSNIGVTRKLMNCMKPRTWLNDEVMNVCMALLLERDKEWRAQGKDYPKCHFFNTFFFNKLFIDKRKYDYSQVQRWTLAKKLKNTPQTSKSILECDRVIAPVHLGCHWTCAVVDLKNKEFGYYDSMLEKNKEIMECLQKYIADEYKDKRNEEVDTKSWPIKYQTDIPRQMNGCDCGVFALMFAEHLSRDAPLEFDQSHMQYFRIMIAAAIMDQKLISEFEE